MKQKHPSDAPYEDPTRKVESMSSMAADLLLQNGRRSDLEEEPAPQSPAVLRSTPVAPSTLPDARPQAVPVLLLVIGAIVLVVASVTITLLVAR